MVISKDVEFNEEGALDWKIDDGKWHDQKIDVFSQVQECRSNK